MKKYLKNWTKPNEIPFCRHWQDGNIASWTKEVVLTANQEESWAVQLLASILILILKYVIIKV